MRFMFTAGFFLFLIACATQACWTEYNSIGMIHDAKRLTPENFQWIIDQYSSDFYKGFETQIPDSSDRKTLIPVILDDSRQAIRAFSSEMAYRRGAGFLGRIARYVNELHGMLQHPDRLSDPHWSTDYAIFLQKKREFFRIRWAGIDQRPRTIQQLETLLAESTRRMDRVSEILTETLNRENRGIASYDTRSAPFGVGSIAYSSAVSTMAMTWMYIWDQAGGISEP
ncbi:MAG TPA: hypothetical protein PLV45_05150 [bacterium]|nr:hypothetical protein [bacterium]